jgi:hypothetical protein
MIQGKLKEMVDAGEGHTIFKTEHVIDALLESGYDTITVESKGRKKNGYIRIKSRATGIDANVVLIYPPKRAPRSKYDIVSWGDKMATGIHDLSLMQALIRMTGKPFDGADFMGRGSQYRAYYAWLQEEGLLPNKEA